MDLALPDSGGDQVINQLKLDPSTKHIPVMVVTAYYEGAPVVESALAAGACEILYKPVALRTTLERVLTITPNEGSERQAI